MADLTKQQREYLQYLLTSDQGSNHQLLTYYLKLVVANRPLELELPDKTILRLSPEEAWQEINAWQESKDISLPMGDTGSREIRASRLLNSLKLLQGNTREASTNLQSILESARTSPLKNTSPTTSKGRELKKMLELRDLQIEIHNRQALGQLATQLEQTSFIKRFAGDRPTQIAIAGLFAANAANLRNSTLPKLAIAEEITKLVQLNAGRTKGLNNAAHLAYSNAAQTTELEEISETINSFVKKNYSSESDFVADTRRTSHLSHILTVADVPVLVDMLAPNYALAAQKKLSEALQTTIIRSTDDYYTSGETLLSHAFNLAGLPSNEANNLAAFAPLLEEIRGTELHNTLSGDIKENDTRIPTPLTLAWDTRVSTHIPWLDSADLDARAVALQAKYQTQDLAASLRQELTAGKDANFEKISEISLHISDREQFRSFHQSIDGNGIYYWREQFGKVRGRIAATTAPIDRFAQKVGKTYWAVDDFAHAPFRYVADQWAKVEEKIPILNPGKFISDKVSGGQLWVAEKILDWSDSLIGKGHWASGILTHVSDFTRGFISEGGSWSSANFVFIQNKWGNLLDWGARKAGYDAGLQGFKATIGSGLWNGFAKLAPGMAEKLSSGGFGKLIASLVAGELTAGTSLLIQAGLIVGWEAIKGVWKFITNAEGFRDKFIDRLPYLIGIASGGLAALPGALAAGIIASGSALLGALGSIITALTTTIFVPALIVVGITLGTFFLVYQIFETTTHIDSQSGIVQLFTDIVCEEDSAATDENPAIVSGGKTSKVASCASCLVKYLSQCYGQSVTGTKIKSKGISCIIASVIGADSAAAIEASATYYNYLQCVGFARAAAVCAGGDLPGQAVASDYIRLPTPGYTFVRGVQSCQSGDFGIIDGAIGHIFVWGNANGALVDGIDANKVCAGCVSAKTPIPFSSVAGCLKKN